MNIRQLIFGAMLSVIAAAWLPGSMVTVATAADTAPGKLVYVGGTGSVGRHALPMLRERGYSIRAITRNPARAVARYGDDYQWMHGDVRDPEQMAELLAGADYVMCSIGYTEFEGPNGPQFVDYMGVRNLVDAARAGGVKHFVLVAAGNTGPQADHTLNPRFGYVAYWKNKGENYLKQSGVPFTIVGPTGFVDGEGGTTGIYLAGRDEYHMATIRRADVAAVAVGTLNNPDAIGKSLFIKNDESVEVGAWRERIGGIAPE
jgi:uncharacterized protein YbjT (DUF2867 family)